MKIFGKNISKPAPEIVVIPREEGDLIIRAEAVMDYTEFEKICPEPTPKLITYKGSAEPVPFLKDPDYIAAVEKRASQRVSWMIIQSLAATEGLTWDTVDSNNPETWSNVDKELTDAGFSPMYKNAIIEAVIVANGLSDARLKEAKDRFLAMKREQASVQSSPEVEN